jgi:hypothetical protein
MKLRRMRCAGHVARMGAISTYKFLVGKLEWKRPVGRRTRRWEDNIKMDKKEIGCGLDSSG